MSTVRIGLVIVFFSCCGIDCLFCGDKDVPHTPPEQPDKEKPAKSKTDTPAECWRAVLEALKNIDSETLATLTTKAGAERIKELTILCRYKSTKELGAEWARFEVHWQHSEKDDEAHASLGDRIPSVPGVIFVKTGQGWKFNAFFCDNNQEKR